LDGLSFLSVDEGERTWMEIEFEESEVLYAVMNSNGDKVLGPDGFFKNVGRF
jgi:hypothetical protein